MNVLGKIIAIIAFVFIILIIVNYKTILPYFDNIAIGGGAASPFQIGASYVDQANKLSPYNAGGGIGTSAPTTAVTYGSYLANQQGTGKKVVSRGKITVEKIDSQLVLTTENVSVQNPNPKIHIWLTNKPTITDTTKFIDFGVMRNGGIQTYTLNLGPVELSLTEYKHVMIIDEQSHTIYGQSTLSK